MVVLLFSYLLFGSFLHRKLAFFLPSHFSSVHSLTVMPSQAWTHNIDSVTAGRDQSRLLSLIWVRMDKMAHKFIIFIRPYSLLLMFS